MLGDASVAVPVLFHGGFPVAVDQSAYNRTVTTRPYWKRNPEGVGRMAARDSNARTFEGGDSWVVVA